MNKIDKFFIVGCGVFILTLLMFFGYHNFNWFPEKNRCIYTIEIQYQSGRNIIKQYELPKNSTFGIYLDNNRYGESTTYLRYHFSKPFGNERGVIAFEVDDYKILNINQIKQ